MSNQEIYDKRQSQNIWCKAFERGRKGVLSILEHGSQELNIVNVYTPHHKLQQRDQEHKY